MYQFTNLGLNSIRILRPRRCELSQERALGILYRKGTRVLQAYIDPVTVLDRITGLRNHRNYKTVSFALGLMDAGFQVEVQYLGEPPKLFSHPPLYASSYYLIGLAWAHRSLEFFQSLIERKIRFEDRARVWESTAKYYAEDPSRFRTEPLRLIVT